MSDIADEFAVDMVVEPLHNRLDLEAFTPRLLALVSNALVRRESAALRRRFGLGTNEWRVLSALATRPGISMTEISSFLGVNKAIVSKSVHTLIDHGLTTPLSGPRGSHSLYLTRSGADMYHGMLPLSLRGQDLISAEMSGEEIAWLNDALHRMLSALHRADEADAAADEADASREPDRAR